MLIADDDAALATLNQLRALGVHIALDDFGTGYSSLQYLQRFPFDKIKIDRSFVKEVTRNSSSASIIRAVVSIAADRNMITTAEGVETLQQRETVQNLGCTQMQGYLFSAARPAQEIRALLASGPPASRPAARGRQPRRLKADLPVARSAGRACGNRLPENARQQLDRIGLLNQFETAMGILRQHVAVAAGQHHGQAGVALANDAGEFDAVHPGHDDVGKYQVGGKLVLGKDGKRCIGAGDAADRVSEILQQLGGELPDVVIVLDHEDAIAAAAGGGLAAGRGGFDGVDRHRGLRQVDRKGRTLAGLARDLDVAVGLLGKAERLAEAEAGALADFLGGEERLEDRLEQFGRDAGAGVRHGDGDEVAAARRPGRGARGCQAPF